MRAIAAVLKKEVLDNLRDRQTLFYALMFGPVLLPLLVAGSLVASLKQMSIDYAEVTELAVINAEKAPNLVRFLHQNNIDTVAAPDDFEAALRDLTLEAVLEIPEAYAVNLREGKPAPLILYSNDGDKDSTRMARKIANLLSVHEHTLNSLRMQTRGLDPDVFNSIKITRTDVSREGAGGQIIASLLPFLLIISMVMGGFYLAIDTTAGERERHSLEPLLSLPLDRRSVVLGKYLATLVFVVISGLLASISLYLLFRFFPSDLLQGMVRFDGSAITKAFLMAFPLTFLITSLLIAVSAFTRSTKEAQTYLGVLMVIPMAPFFLLQFVKIKSAATVMALPMMSQYKLLEKVAKSESISAWHVFLSASGTLLAAVLILSLAIWLYRQDRILM